MLKIILKVLNAAVDFLLALALLAAGAFSGYALWDNSRVYADAAAVHTELMTCKPQSGAEAASFEELRRINPDVCAWITLDDTGIDYPVVQGTDNLCYLNTDVYGDFSLAGSIYLDARCDGAFGGRYALLYGHHMENHGMFGDLDLYKDERFFAENTGGTLLLPDGAYSLTVFAVLLVPAGEQAVFAPQQWQEDVGGLLDFAERNAVQLRRSVSEQLHTSAAPVRLLALSTCAAEFTDARTVVLASVD